MKMKRMSAGWLLVLLVLALGACSSPAEKKQKFMDKGTAYYEQGDFVKAFLEVRNAITIDPEYVEAYYLAAKIALSQGKAQDAFNYFSKTVEKQPDHAGANLELGRFFLANKELGMAREKVDLVLAKEPDNIQAQLFLGAVLLAEDKAGQAREMLEKLLPKAAGEVNLYMLLAAVYQKLNEGEKVQAILEQGAVANPKSVGLHAALVDYYVKSKQLNKVEKELQQISALEPDNVDHVLRLAGYYWQMKQQDEAAALIRGLVEKEKNNEQRWVDAARFYLVRNEFEQAGKLLSEGLQNHPQSFALRLLQRDVYVAQQKIDKAIAVLQECLAMDDKNADYITALRGLAELYYRLGSIDEAEKYVADALKRSPQDLDSHLLNGTILQLKGELDQAIAEYRVVQQGRLESIPVALKLAEAYAQNKQLGLARETLQQALKVEENSPQVLSAMARLANLQKDYPEAESLLLRIVTTQPNNPAAMADLADFYLAHGKQDKALQLYQKIVEQVPGNAQSHLKLASFYAREKKLDKAMETVTSGLSRLPDSALLLEYSVRVALDRQRPAEALALIEERLSRHPDDILAHALTGAVAMSGKDYPAAERAYRKAMALDMNRPESAASLANVLVLSGQGEKGVVEAEQQLANPPRTLGAYLLLGSLHEGLKQPQKAIAVYERAVLDHPENWIVNNNLAYLLSEQSASPADLAKALELAKKAQLLDPENYAVLDTIGWIYYKMGKFEQAQAALALVLGGNQNAPVFQYHMGMVQLKLGKNEEAKERLKLAVASGQSFSGKEDAEKALKELN